MLLLFFIKGWLVPETNPLAIYVEEGDQVNIKYMDTGETFLRVKELVIQGLE